MILYFNYDVNGNYKLETNSNFALHFFEKQAKEFYDPLFQNNNLYNWIKTQLNLIKKKFPKCEINLELIDNSINPYYMFVIKITDNTEKTLCLLRFT